MQTKYGVIGESRIGYDRRWESKSFGPDVKYFGLIDYVGTGLGGWNEYPGNCYGVNYCRAESFYRAFALTKFAVPCLVDCGELPSDDYTDDGDPISDVEINMAACFKGSDIQMLPHGFSRHLIANLNSCFDGCAHLRAWTPSELVDEGLALVRDPDAPQVLRSNGLASVAFLLNLQPKTMRRMFADCVAYNGQAINAISWKGLIKEDAALDFAVGCRFDHAFLKATVARLHWQAIREKSVRSLTGVHLGYGHVDSEMATQIRELGAVGIEVVVDQS